LRSALDQKL
jgi:hypothetical protein